MRRKSSLAASLVLVLMAASMYHVNADTWALPKTKQYYSPNKKYYLEVTPKKLESQLQYFQDKVEGRQDAGAVKGLKENRAHASFYVVSSGGGYSKKSEFPLVNEVSPVSAVVSSRGDYIVTFDNWHSTGYGEDVVVIYRPNGTVIKKFSLEELLTEGDIETLSHSISSIDWGGDHYIDEMKGILILKIVSNGKSTWDKEVTFHELKIELATGKPMEAKRDLFPQLRVSSSVDSSMAAETILEPPGKSMCTLEQSSFDSSEGVRFPSEQFYSRAKERPSPVYPPIAKAAHAQGTVILELLVSKMGDVFCARMIDGHPLFRSVATTAALKWKFEPFERDGQPVVAVGRIALNFKMTETYVSPIGRQ